MKRYDVYADDNGPSVEEERPNGVYVYYEDAARIIAQRDRLVELLHHVWRNEIDVSDECHAKIEALLSELNKEKKS